MHFVSSTPAGPTYGLDTVKACVRAGRYRLTDSAREGAALLYLDPSDIAACVLELDDADFWKTMESEKRPGFFQDVYRPRYLGYRIYVKVQIYGYPNKAVVISFKKDESR